MVIPNFTELIGIGEMSTIGGTHGIASASVIANADVELYAMDVYIVNRLFESESGLVS